MERATLVLLSSLVGLARSLSLFAETDDLAISSLPLNLSESFRDHVAPLLLSGFPDSPPPVDFLSSAELPEGDETPNLQNGVYRVYRIVPRKESELTFLKALATNATKYDFDFWKGPKELGHAVDVMVPPGSRRSFRRMLRRARITSELIIPDVEKKMMESEAASRGDAFGDKVLRDSVPGRSFFNFREYQSYETMRRYLRSVEFAYPRIAKVYTIGTSHEGRPIELMKIGNPVTDDTKRIIWIDGGMHAREWAAPHVATYLIYQLTSKYGRDPAVTAALNSFNFFIAPNVNPDGYEYSRSASHPVVRLWRKNRSPSVCPQASLCCSGVDLNRNFDIEFAKVGSSPHPCSGIHHGTRAFSEPESRAVRDVVWGRRHQIDAFITLHTYAQMWTHPYGFVRGRYPRNIGELQTVGRKAVAALKQVHGTRYVVGSSADLLYPSAGGSDDWASVKAGIRFVYLLEMRPDQHHKDGFILPENQLLPTAQETFAGIVATAGEILKTNRLGTSILSAGPAPLRAPLPATIPSPISSIVGGSQAGRGGSGGCSDQPNPFARQWTCRQQKGWGWCGTAFMRGYCKLSCGQCQGGPPEPCDDRAPLGQHKCRDYAQWGMCDKPFMFGFCEITCGKCKQNPFG